MKKVCFIILSLLLVLQLGCNIVEIEEIEEEKTTYEESDGLAKSIDRDILSGNEKFGFKLFKEILTDEKYSDKNIAISPISISSAFTMAYIGAKGETKEEMAEVMELSGLDLDTLNLNYKDLLLSLNLGDEKVRLNICNSLWEDNGFSVKESYVEDLEKYYSTSYFKRDLGSSDAIKEINDYISDKTEGLINNFLNDGDLKDVVLALINTVYFNGEWTTEFKEEDTQKQEFTLEDGTSKKVDMMNIEDEFDVYDSNDYFMVKLPYGRERFSMYAITSKNTEIDEFINNYSISDLDYAINNSFEREIVLKFPKFEIETNKIKLNDYLTNLGMEKAFTELANFENIAKKIFISKAMHKTVIKVDEKGTEAAAVAEIDMVVTAILIRDFYSFNKPFFFLIRDDISGTILFMGKLEDPEN